MFTSGAILLGICLLGTRISADESLSDCPHGFEYVAEVNTCLKVIFEDASYGDSEKSCMDSTPGGHFAAILSKEGNAAVVSFLTRKVKDKPENVRCKHIDDTNEGMHFWLGAQSTDWHNDSAPPFWHLGPYNIRFPFNDYWQEGKNPEERPQPSPLRAMQASSSAEFRWRMGDYDRQYCVLCEV